MNDWRVFALSSALFAAITAILAKIAVVDIDSNLATFIRTLVIVAVTAAIVSLRGGWSAEISGRSLALLGASGIATGLSWLCYFRALQLGPASRVAPVDKLSVVLVVLIAAAVLHEPLTLKVGIGTLLITAGAVVLAF
jgi:transporter family protein